MFESGPRKFWRHFPILSALIVGFGALFAGDARADKLASAAAAPLDKSDEVMIRTAGEKVYVSQGGGAYEELSLANTPETARLRQLLKDAGGAGTDLTVPLGSIIVANGGGNTDGAKPKGKKKSAPKPTSEPAKKSEPTKY